MTLRHGPVEPDRGPTSASQNEQRHLTLAGASEEQAEPFSADPALTGKFYLCTPLCLPGTYFKYQVAGVT